MVADWTADELSRIDRAKELQVTGSRADGTQYAWTPIWVVRVQSRVYVRTWYRRDTGWWGRAVRSGSARIRVPGVETEVTVVDIGSGPEAERKDVDAAYRSKYGRLGARRMVGDTAAAATLRLEPVAGTGRGLNA